MINRVVLVGRLTQDPVLRQTEAGNSVCSFSVAVDKRIKKTDGKSEANYIPCIAFRETADNIHKFLKKGSLVGVDGRLNQRKYERKDGVNTTVIEVLCDSVRFLEKKSSDSNADIDAIADAYSGGNSSEEETSKNMDSLDFPDADETDPF